MLININNNIVMDVDAFCKNEITIGQVHYSDAITFYNSCRKAQHLYFDSKEERDKAFENLIRQIESNPTPKILTVNSDSKKTGDVGSL